MDQQVYWNNASAKKEFTTPFKADLFTDHVTRDAKILDFGCGYGRILKNLNYLGYSNLSGVDFSIDMIKRAEKELPFAQFIHNDTYDLPFEDNSFDAVIIVAVLTCIVSENDLENLMKEIDRVLKNDGILYINDFLINTDERNLKRYKNQEGIYPYGVFRLDEGALLRHFEKSRIEDLLFSFKTIFFEEVVYKTMNGNRSNGFFYLGEKK